MVPAHSLRPVAFETAVLVAAFFVVSVALATGLPATLDLPVRDTLLRALPSRPVEDVAVVAIDEASLATEGPWPWPRARLAAIAVAAREAGARVLALDLLLVAPGEGDDVLAASLAAMPSVLAAGLDAKAGWLLPAPTLRGAGRLAETSFDVDHDGVMRRMSATKQRDGVSLPALSVAAASLATDPGRPVPVGRVLVPDFRHRPAGVPVVGAADLLAGRADGTLRGRVVFLGVTAAGLGDRFVTPGSPPGTPEPGVLVHAATASCLLAGGLLRSVPPFASGLLASAMTGLALLAGRSRPRHRRLFLGGLALLPLGLGAPLLAAGLELPVATLTGATLLVLLAVEARAARLGEREAARGAALRTEELEARRVAVHEMKTPLTAVRGLTQLLSGFDLSPAERARVVGMVGEETERLGGMIESLNAVEKMRLASFDATARPVDLGALAARRAAAIGAGAPGRVSVEAGEGVFVLGDEAFLARVFDNLVSNALKFSPPSSRVRIAVALREGDALLTVADEGPGIPEVERERVFGRFIRGSGAGGAEGLGLGLSLVHEVVTWHRGRVSVRGAEGTGSVFEVVLPALREVHSNEEPDTGHDPGR
ncbi:MAG: CHASE2 domain-containing protein [Holophagales bacterium]|nr:CHASE2 domain-containing protein [Holophagales bacterium]